MSGESPLAAAATRHDAVDTDALDRFGFVTPRTRHDLDRFVSLLRVWQQTHNLVAPSTLEQVWSRHVADSLQLLDHAPEFGEWVDLGSGAGFPGLVVAIAVKDRPGSHVTLVESNRKKAAFLRAAVRATGVKATVAAARIEAYAVTMAGAADILSARALAPLAGLFPLAAPYLHEGSVLLLHKGRDFVQEVEAASKSWGFDMLTIPSATDPGGTILAIRHLTPKAMRA